MHLADAFIQSDLQLHSGYTFSLVYVFPGNRTHNLLHCWRNALPPSHTGTYLNIILIFASKEVYLVLGMFQENKINIQIKHYFHQLIVFFDSPTVCFLDLAFPASSSSKKAIALKWCEGRGVRWGLCHVCLAGVCVLRGRSQWLMGEDGGAPLSSLMPPSAVRLLLCSGALSLGLLSTSSPPLSFTECCGCLSNVLLLTGVVGVKYTKVQLYSKLNDVDVSILCLSGRAGNQLCPK